MNIFDPLPNHRVLSILLTYQCTAECTHCGTLSSQHERTRLATSDMLSAIAQAATLGYRLVVFSGGEPTLANKDLLLGIQEASAQGMAVRLVTNAYWAVNEKAARERITSFVDAGLTEINFSTGDQHARFVPLERMIRATRAAAAIKLPVAIMVETVRERRITKEVLLAHPEFASIAQDFPESNISIYESHWMPLSPTLVQEYPQGQVINRSNVSFCSGCDSILSTTTIQADGRIGACCGLGMRIIPELHLGNVRKISLRSANQCAEDDLLKRWIRVEGPERILMWASTHDPAIEWEDMYAHRCQACLRLYSDSRVKKVIAEHHQEKLPDILFAEWLLFHYSDSER